MIEKRHSRFAERLTMWMFVLAAVGAGIIILEPAFSWTFDNVTFHIGGRSFSDELRGGVVTIGIIGTITALIRFWFPGSETPPQPIKSNEGDANAKP